MFLAIDVGTQAVKVALFNCQGQRIALAKKELKVNSHIVGYHEQNPLEWWQGIIEICQEFDYDDLKKVQAIGVCGTSLTLIVADLNGYPLIPAILWMDLRAREEAGAINTIAPKEYLNLVGGKESAELLWPKIFWLKRHEPKIYSEAYIFCDCADWITYRLTEWWSMSLATAICKGHYSQKSGWPFNFITELDLDSTLYRLPEVNKVLTQPAGFLQEEPAKILHLPMGIPIVNMGIDGYSALFASTFFEPEKVMISMGTSWSEFIISNQKKNIPGIWGPFEIFSERYIYETGQIQGGDLVDWYFKKDELKYLEQDINVQTMEGARDIFIINPLAQDRVNIKNEGCTIPIVQGIKPNHDRRHLLQAVFETVAFSALSNIKKSGFQPNKIIVCGGGSISQQWLQVVADILQIPLIKPKDTEDALLGAAFGAMLAKKMNPELINPLENAQIIAPDKIASEFYREKYRFIV